MKPILRLVSSDKRLRLWEHDSYYELEIVDNGRVYTVPLSKGEFCELVEELVKLCQRQR